MMESIQRVLSGKGVSLRALCKPRAVVQLLLTTPSVALPLGPLLRGRDPTATGGGGRDHRAHVSQEATDSVCRLRTFK